MDLSTSVTIIGWFVQVLLDQGITFAIDHWGGGAAGDPDLPVALDSLRDAMNNVCAFLPLAQGKGSENRGVQLWFKDLKAAAYDAEDLLSELDYYRLEKQVEGEDNSKSRTFGDSLIETTTGFFSNLLITDDNQASTSSPLPSSRDSESTIVPRIREVVRRLEHIFTELSRVLNLLNPENIRQIPPVFPEASHRITTSFLLRKETVIGRVSERDQIITSLLMPAAASVCVVPIVGMGGVGKTTLARMVYNDEQIKNHFECRMWICVSDDFDVARLTREMLECLGVGSDHIKNLNRLQELLMQKLQPVRFLIVLDDVWNESEMEKWGSLCAPLRSKKGGSRILMTTRLNSVVSIAAKNIDMLSSCPLEGLPKDQYLSLFNTYAFGDPNPNHHPSLVEIGKLIAGRLKGSPLAAKTVGGLLRDYLDEDHWRSVLYSDIWQLPQRSHNDIVPVLQLSYQHLPPHLQQCFIYCNLFPKDRQFEKDEMVGMWISQGYVHAKCRGNKSVEEIGNEYFDNLLSRSFIQASDDKTYVLHDLLHDLAESVSENEYHKINSKQRKEITSSVRHLHVHSKDLSFLKSCNLRILRTLMVDGIKSDDYSVLKEVLDGLKSIRVLILNNVSEQLLSGSIGQLTHLRYLAVYSKEYGESIVSGEGAAALPAATNSMASRRPYHLQWLISGKGGLALPAATNSMAIRRPYHLQWLISGKGGLALPAATKYLVSLRHFGSVYNHHPIWHKIHDEIALMSWIGKLTCLQELNCFRVGKTEGRKLAELKRLNELKGTLRLECLDNASTKEEALEANLNKKVGIRELVLHCGNGHATAHMAEEVFEGLCPPPYIKELELGYYLGVESPPWMMTVNCCLSVLQSLELYKCWNWKVLPPLGQLPLLRHLEIYKAYAVEEIGSGFYGSGAAITFPCLETLKFRGMPELVVWSGANGDTDSLFPPLRKLTVMKCWKLERAPMQCLASVEVLDTDCMLLLAQLEKLTSLKKLIVEHCEEMQSLPLLSASLETLEIDGCNQLSSLFTTETERKLPSLREITISHCDQLSSLFTTEMETKLPSFREIRIDWCGQLVSAEMKSLPSLQKLRIYQCRSMLSVPLLPATLEELEINSCWMLTAFSGEQEENLSDLTSLQKITIEHCHCLLSLPLMPASLQQFDVSDCPQLHSLPLIPASLQYLRIHHCSQLHSLPLMPASLQLLSIYDCPQLHSLPLMPASLQELFIYDCPELPRERYQEGGDDWHKISHVPYVKWV